ncbi:MAG: pH-response regulator protein palH/rim21 [Caeruleum heppii]|nr:MAG: pH-response regulator protein palH/rim21 [Caeruleum heppii]
MSPWPDLDQRQIGPQSTTTSSVSTPHCTPFTLPSLGVVSLDVNSVITLTTDIVFHPQCTNGAQTGHVSSVGPSDVADLRDPFYASTIVQTYAIATTTILSYMLVIMLLITPRTFYVGGPRGGGGFLGGRGIISGASGRASVIGVGGRPWLQKVAALTVAISLTIATADTFRVAKQQYHVGYMDATALRDQVAGGIEIRAIRVISDTFLWLAQVQTLTRLFPRHKEKVTIMWVGFVLIVFDIVFAILNAFVFASKTRSRGSKTAIPTLSYLFHLALSFLYTAWVLYYAFTKRRYAFYHRKMRNICLVAVLALASVLIPITFFVLDIANPKLAGWGDYVRWVGAAAASVVVWEWVERIEALERDERKDGVLGREIYDGDEMLHLTPSEEVVWPASTRRDQGSGGSGGGTAHTWGRSASGHDSFHFTSRRSVPKPNNTAHAGGIHCQSATHGALSHVFGSVRFSDIGHQRPVSTPPPIASSPVSRTDTASAASTVYTVRYHPISQATPPIPEVDTGSASTQPATSSEPTSVMKEEGLDRSRQISAAPTLPTNPAITSKFRWLAVSNPFKRKRSEPPQEVARSTAPRQHMSQTDAPRGDRRRFSIRASRTNKVHPDQLPITIIPAQARGRTWTPQTLPLTEISGSTEEPRQSGNSDVPTQADVSDTNHRDGQSLRPPDSGLR